jgi:phenylpyruvate tautomerase PptA (4-oxalocrotonate tautomerase family)
VGVKLLRTIRLDQSDTFVFERAAEPGDWAVSGAFAFWAGDPARLEGKARSAFRGGFLGVGSHGWSTLVQIVEADEEDRANLVDLLARLLVDQYGAPDMETARAAAEEEVGFAESLATQPADTLVAVHRTWEDGEVRETFRTLHRREGEKPARAFSFLEVEGEEDKDPGEQIDLIGMTGRERK